MEKDSAGSRAMVGMPEAAAPSGVRGPAVCSGVLGKGETPIAPEVPLNYCGTGEPAVVKAQETLFADRLMRDVIPFGCGHKGRVELPG